MKVEEYLKIYNPKAPIEFLGRGYTIRDLCTVDGKDYCDFVDEVYNKNLVEEILIKSFKGYDMKNNFSTNKDTTSSCSVFKNTACCIII